MVVVGGGPAGMSSSLWLHHLGLDPVLIDPANVLGGAQNLSYFGNHWLLGARGRTGRDLADHFARHLQAEPICALLGHRIESIERICEGFVIVAGETEIRARCIVVATGQRLNGVEVVNSIRGSEHLLSCGRVSFNPGDTPQLADAVCGAVVGVVGGGDNGLVTALYMARSAERVHLFIRSGVRAFEKNKTALLAEIAAGRIVVHRIAEILEFGVAGDTIRVCWRDRDCGTGEVVVDYLALRLGFRPNVEEVSDLLARGGVGVLERTQTGHLATDRYLRTSIPSVYAAGDVVNQRDPCVATALASGAIVARSIEEDLSDRCWHPAQREDAGLQLPGSPALP